MTRAPDIAAIDRAHIWHPYTQHGIAAESIPVSRGDGSYLVTEDGRRIFDAISSWWVTLHGHAHPAISEAVAEQARKLEQVIFAGFTHEPAARLAAELVRITPEGLTRVFYTDDGSTAVEVAVKMALQYWSNAGEQRSTIVALDNAYHGDTFGAMSVSARSVFTQPFDQKLFDVVHLPDPVTHDCAAAFRDVLDRRPRDIAAIIVEPMLQGAGGMRMWSAEMLRALRTAAADSGVLFIADEVLTGFGRTGPLFACEHAGISPDILCLSKGLTGGFLPLGATLTTDRVFERFVSRDASNTLFHGHSYTANPLACAAALASAALLNSQATEQRRTIELAHRAAAQRFAEINGVRNARVLGTAFAFEIGDADNYLNPLSRALRAFALDRDVLLRPLGNTVYFLPPYSTTPADLMRAYEVVFEYLETR